MIFLEKVCGNTLESADEISYNLRYLLLLKSKMLSHPPKFVALDEANENPTEKFKERNFVCQQHICLTEFIQFVFITNN